MLFRWMGLVGALAVGACASSEAVTESEGGASSTGGNATTTGAAGEAAGSEATGAGGDTTGGGVTTAGGVTTGGGATTGGGGMQSMLDGSAMTGDAQGCNPVTERHATEGNAHAQVICSPLVFRTNPPSSGTHYGIWAVYQTYSKPFLPGFWVHNLEHGAVVITYNCPNGCQAEVSAAQALIDALPADPGCAKRRVIMLPNPDLDVRFAASAWTLTLKASCFDSAAFRKFVTDNIGHGLEPVCDDGYDPLTDGQNGMPICP